MEKITIVSYFDDIDGKFYEYFNDSYILINDLALTIDKDSAHLERVVPSVEYPGCYELIGQDYIEFTLTNTDFLDNISGMDPIELLGNVLNGAAA